MPTFEEVQSFIEQNQNDEKVKNYIGGFITPDRVISFLESDEGKKVLQPRLDKYHSKGLETWKQNNLPKIIDEEITKRNPTETPEQKRLRKIEEENQALSNKIKRSEYKNRLINQAEQDQFPLGLIDFALAPDEETTLSNYNSLKETFNNAVEKAVKGAMANGGRRPPADKGGGGKPSMNNLIRKAAGYQSA